jgi:deoxyribonuclease-4
VKIGANVSIAGKGLLAAVEETLEYEATSFMIYTRSNRGGNARDITKFFKEEAFELMKKHELDIRDAVVHAPYYINLAGEGKARNIGIAVLKDEIERTEYLEIPYLVFHPGSHVQQGVEKGIQNIIDSLNVILTGQEKIHVLLETMAGDGSKVGNSFEEIAQIIEGVDEDKRHVLGVCMDTCHNFAYGYDIVNEFEDVLNSFDRIIGLDRLKVLHLNDSKHPQGSRKDRHANIGADDGHIPKEALRAICHHPIINQIPIILETPYGQYKEEIDYLRGNDDASLAPSSLK